MSKEIAVFIGKDVCPMAELLSTQYTLYLDVSDTERQGLGDYTMLIGGEQEISVVKYNVIDTKGFVTTKFIPGQTTFNPVTIYRPMDRGAMAIYRIFYSGVYGQLINVRRNYSISLNDHNAKPQVWWHLLNAIPTKIGGFDFNQRTESIYTDFELTLQPEEIQIVFDVEQEEEWEEEESPTKVVIVEE